MAALDPRPQPREEAAEEEALRGQHPARQVRLEEADGRPGGGDGARGEGGHAEGAGDNLADCRHGEVVQGLEARDNGEGRADDEEEARHRGERAEPKGDKGAGARRVRGVQRRARERRDERVRLARQRRYGLEAGREHLLGREHGGRYVRRPVEPGHAGEALDHVCRRGPFCGARVALGARVQVSVRVFEDELAIRLPNVVSSTQGTTCGRREIVKAAATHGRETVPVKHDGVQQLAKRQRLKHPASKPPRPLALLAPPDAPDEALALADVPAKLERAEHGVDGDGDAQLLRGIHAQRNAGERGANGRRIRRRERRRSARVPSAKRLNLRIQEVSPQPREEAEEKAVQEQYGREGDGESQGRRLEQRLLWALVTGTGGLSVSTPAIISEGKVSGRKKKDKPRIHAAGNGLPALHANHGRDKHPQRVPHSRGVVVVAALPLRLQRLVHRRRRGRCPAQRPGPRNDVPVQRGIFARRNGIPERVAEDGVDGGRRRAFGGRRRGCH